MQIYLLLTESCNLNCSYCIRGNKKNEYIDVSILKQIIKRNDFSDCQVLLTGGEPLLHPQIFEITNFCLDSFKYVAINTNATMYKKCQIPKSDRLHLQISLDGNELIHNRIRGEGTYKLVIEALNDIDKSGYSYNVASVINKMNYDYIDQLIPIIYRFKNMKYWKVEPELPFGCGNKDDCIGIIEWNSLVDKLIDISPFRLRVKKLFDFSILDSLSDEKWDMLKNRKFANCGSCNNKVYIYPDFTVYPCTCLTDFPLGNLKDSNLNLILQQEKASVFSQYRVKQGSICFNCKYYDICKGGCIGCSYHYYGELGMGDGRCPLMN